MVSILGVGIRLSRPRLFQPVCSNPFVQLGDDLLHLVDHVRDAPLSVAANGVGAVKRDYIAMPVGAFSAWRRARSPNRYDFVAFSHRFIPGEQIGNWNGQTASQRGGWYVCVHRNPPAPNSAAMIPLFWERSRFVHLRMDRVRAILGPKKRPLGISQN